MAFADVVLAAKSIVRPWTDLRAVKLTQVDVVRSVADQRSDLAAAMASVDALASELALIKLRLSEHDVTLRELRAAAEGAAPGPAEDPSRASPRAAKT